MSKQFFWLLLVTFIFHAPPLKRECLINSISSFFLCYCCICASICCNDSNFQQWALGETLNLPFIISIFLNSLNCCNATKYKDCTKVGEQVLLFNYQYRIIFFCLEDLLDTTYIFFIYIYVYDHTNFCYSW